MSGTRGRSTTSDSSGHRWNFWGTVLTALITALGTILTTYLTVIRPGTERVAKDVARRALAETKLVQVAANVRPQKNESRGPLFAWGYCNSTIDTKSIEVRVGETSSDLTLAQTASGHERIAVSFLVPPGWMYQVKHDSVAGIGCNFTGWYL